MLAAGATSTAARRFTGRSACTVRGSERVRNGSSLIQELILTD